MRKEKRKQAFKAILAAAVLLLGTPAVSAETVETDLLPTVTFEDGVLPVGFNVSNKNGTVEVSSAPDGGMALHVDQTAAASNAGVTYQLRNLENAVPEHFTVSYRLYPADVSRSGNYFNLSIGDQQAVNLVVDASKKLIARTSEDPSSGDGKVYHYLTDAPLESRWYSIEATVDNAERTYTVKVDEGEAEQFSFRNTGYQADSLNFLININKSGEFYVDDIRVYCLEEEPPEDDLPQIQLSGLVDGAEIVKSDLGTLHAAASDRDGMDRLELYLDGVLVSQAKGDSLDFDLSDLAYGEHAVTVIAYDLRGNTSEKRAAFQVVRDIRSVTLQEDFNKLSLARASKAATLPGGILLYGQRGYYQTDTLDSAHGSSLVLGIDEKPNVDSGSAAIIWIPAGSSKGRTSLECEIYLEKLTSFYNMELRGTSGANIVNVLRIDGEQVTSNGLNTGAACEAGRWYSLRIDVDMPREVFRVYLDQTQLTGEVSFSGRGLDQLEYFRLYAPKDESVPAFLAVDNIRVYERLSMPEILSIGYDGLEPAEQVGAGAATLELYLSERLYGPSVQPEHIRIESSYGEVVPVTRAAYNQRVVTLTLGGSLSPGADYQVTIDGAVEIIQGTALDEPVCVSFQTVPAQCSARNVVLDASSTGLQINAELVNRTDENRTCYVVVTVWDGQRFISAQVIPQTAKAGQTTPAVMTAPPLGAGQTAEVYIWDSLTAPASLASEVYSIAGRN